MGGKNGERGVFGVGVRGADNPDKGKKNPTAITSAAFSPWSSQLWVSHTFEIRELSFQLFSSFLSKERISLGDLLTEQTETCYLEFGGNQSSQVIV